MIKIWHKKDPNFREATTFPLDDYEAIAEVASDDLDKAFEVTNTISHFWAENEEVSMLVNKGCRSSSVGDLFQLNGKFYQVMGRGFEAVVKN